MKEDARGEAQRADQMDQTQQMNQTNPSSSIQEDEVNLLDYWRVIRKHHLLVGGLFFVSVALALAVSLLMPNIYESTATLLPPAQPDNSSGLSALLGASPVGGAAQGLGITLPGMPATSTDLFVAMLSSRVMLDAVIARFDLKTLYEQYRWWSPIVVTMKAVRQWLADSTDIKVTKEGTIEITVEARDSQLASDIANFYVANLERLSRTLNITKASLNRAFIERRLAETRVNMVKAEEELKEFQTHNKTVAVEAQSAAMIEAAAMIQGQITAQEVQLQVMSSYLSPGNPDLFRVRSSIEELKKQLYLLESGKGGKGMLPGDRLHPAMITVPGLALDYGRLMRELKVQETLNTLLTSEYEQAKLTEARDTPTVQVLDPAIPAERKSRPIILLNMILAGVLALFIGIFLAFFLEYLERIKSGEPSSVEP